MVCQYIECYIIDCDGNDCVLANLDIIDEIHFLINSTTFTFIYSFLFCIKALLCKTRLAIHTCGITKFYIVTYFYRNNMIFILSRLFYFATVFARLSIIDVDQWSSTLSLLLLQQ